jgi:hypothetical protein
MLQSPQQIKATTLLCGRHMFPLRQEMAEVQFILPFLQS